MSELYANEWVRVDTVPAKRGDGTPYQHHRVQHHSGMGSLVVVTCVKRGVVYFGMVRQDRVAAGLENCLEFVRGGADDLGPEGAARELAEEMSINVEPDDLEPLGFIHPDTGILSTKVAIWNARVSADDMEASKNHTEHESGLNVAWYPKHDLTSLIRNGEITCGLTLAAYALADAQGLLNGGHE